MNYIIYKVIHHYLRVATLPYIYTFENLCRRSIALLLSILLIYMYLIILNFNNIYF